jgi:hypothetical protein
VYKESAGESWDQMPRVNRVIADRQAREWYKRGGGSRLYTYGSHRKKEFGLRPGVAATRASNVLASLG